MGFHWFVNKKSVIKDMVEYDEIRNELKTGDIVLFGGKSFVSWLIKKITKNKYSHIGMVLKIEGFDFVALWESTTLNNTPDIFQKKRKGVQIIQLSNRIENYKGRVAIRLLGGYDFTEKDNEIISELRREINDKPYEKNLWSLAKSAIDLSFFGKNKKQDLSSVFCSELVAEAYMRLGLIEENQVSSEYTPADFSEKGKMKMIKGVLGQEIILKK